MGTEIDQRWVSDFKNCLREELETAWLRGYSRGRQEGSRSLDLSPKEPELEAADYAERVVGGSTKPERPEVK